MNDENDGRTDGCGFRYAVTLQTDDLCGELSDRGWRRNFKESAPGIAEEEANSGDADGTGLKAGGGVFLGDATEGEDGNGLREVDSGAEGDQSLAARHTLLGDFFKDGREEQERSTGGLADFFRRMAGSTDDGFAARARIGLLGGADGSGSGVGVEVDAVGSGIEGDLSGAIDEDAGWLSGSADGLDDAGGERLKLGEGEIFFANLDGIDAAEGPFRSESNETIAPVALVTREQAAAGDGVEEHLTFSVRVYSQSVLSLDCKMGTKCAGWLCSAGLS